MYQPKEELFHEFNAAMKTDDVRKFKALLDVVENGPNAIKPNGITFIHLVTAKNKLNLLKVLLDDSRTNLGRTKGLYFKSYSVINTAIENKNYQALKLIINHPNCKDIYLDFSMDEIEERPMAFAIKNNSLQALSILIESGKIDLNQETELLNYNYYHGHNNQQIKEILLNFYLNTILAKNNENKVRQLFLQKPNLIYTLACYKNELWQKCKALLKNSSGEQYPTFNEFISKIINSKKTDDNSTYYLFLVFSYQNSTAYCSSFFSCCAPVDKSPSIMDEIETHFMTQNTKSATNTRDIERP